MMSLPRWIAPAVLAAGLGAAALAPQTAHAQNNELARVIVDVADVIMRGGQPYYRYNDAYTRDDRLIVVRDRYGRPTYYRQVPQGYAPRADAYHGTRYRAGYDRGYAPDMRRAKCNKHGKCKVEYYDPRQDRRGERYYSYDGRRY
ncbi:MAG TPA: hypothetical protein VIG68_05750 [Lysobacter sp.]